MAEMRRDPVSGRWVVIAAERAARPKAFAVSRGPAKGGFCPFCEGNEDRTPPEISAVRSSGTEPNTPGWQVRIVPNKYPALRKGDGAVMPPEGWYERVAANGTHEVIIESPRHVISPTELSQEQFSLVIEAYLERTLSLSREKRMTYVLIFKNVGRAAGASIEHSHSQVIGLPVMPKRVEEEILSCRRYRRDKMGCLFCDALDRELSDGSRIVHENEHFVVFCPYAARFPFEMCLVPKEHQEHFHEIDPALVGSLSGVLRDVLGRLEVCLDDPPYNYLVHSAPLVFEGMLCYHWHIELIPRVTHMAGFEWATGFYINPVEPEAAAQCLREVTEEELSEKLGPEAPAKDIAGAEYQI